MIQDIYPHQLKNEYTPRPPRDGDYVLIFEDDTIHLTGAGEIPRLGRDGLEAGNLLFLFTVDGDAAFLANPRDVAGQALKAEDLSILRSFQPQHLAFAAATGAQLYRWYSARQFCGRCGAPMAHSETERAMCCPACGLIEYPKISPAVIVAVTDGDRLLLTKYAGRAYTRYALIAGFMEIGETFEDTVRREVMEEVGLRVKNVRYYKSQPWAFTDCLLGGFFCELDGDDTITLDTEELAVGEWVNRADLQPRQSEISLTAEMMERFRLGEV